MKKPKAPTAIRQQDVKLVLQRKRFTSGFTANIAEEQLDAVTGGTHQASPSPLTDAQGAAARTEEQSESQGTGAPKE